MPLLTDDQKNNLLNEAILETNDVFDAFSMVKLAMNKTERAVLEHVANDVKVEIDGLNVTCGYGSSVSEEAVILLEQYFERLLQMAKGGQE